VGGCNNVEAKARSVNAKAKAKAGLITEMRGTVYRVVDINEKEVLFFVSIQLYNNTLHNWASLNEKYEREVRPILYTANVTSDELVTSALRLGWTVLQVPRASEFGIPFIKDMYMDAVRRFRDCPFYAYANGDILFDRGLIDTLQAVNKVKTNLKSKMQHTLIFSR